MCCLREPEWSDDENIEGPDLTKEVLKVLEPDAGKLARPVLRGGSHGNVTFLPDNRLTKETNTSLIQYEYDENNRLIRAGNTCYFYDLRGNLIKKNTSDRTAEYAYDAHDNLITYSDGNNRVLYAYDGDGHRISKTVNGENSLHK